MLSYTKRPAEDYFVAVEFADKLPAGTSLSTGTLMAVEHATGTDQTAAVLSSATAVISGTQASFRGKAGTSPTDYLITLTVTLSDGSHLIEEILLQVRAALNLIADPGAADANSYCTRVEADAYHQTHLYNADWLAADDWRKEAALIWATRLLDEQCDWDGTKATNEQALRWPRGGTTDADGVLFEVDEIPRMLKHATAEFARHLLKSDRFQARDDARGGIESVSAGPVSVTFDAVDRISVVPESVWSLLRPIHNGAAGGWEVPLVRT